jgi:riboflavin kinase/FMN adenylyltransferase
MSKKRVMQLVRGLHNLRPQHRGCVATIGNFDGVHRGHQAILGRLRERALELGVPSCVVIFEPQPREFFAPETAPARLARLRDKLQLLADAGVDRVLCRILVDGLGVQHLEVGDDFRFGCDRVGDFDFLQQAGATHGFTVEAAQTVELDGLRVSSTQVRNALAAADFDLAERLLGRPYRIAGRVLHGQKLARQLGTPTANVQLKRRRVPLSGVYLVSVELDGRTWPGVANIGVRPTVAGDGKAHLEVHLLDFAGDLYDRRLTVVFHHKLREEQRFASLEALKTAINADVAAARAQVARIHSANR